MTRTWFCDVQMYNLVLASVRKIVAELVRESIHYSQQDNETKTGVKLLSLGERVKRALEKYLSKQLTSGVCQRVMDF